MSSGSDRRLSIDELKALNRTSESADDSSTTNMPTGIKVEYTISPELAEELIELMELMVRELREIEARLGRLSTEEERKKDRQLLEQIATAIEQAGKRNERRFSLPRFSLPEFNLMWLLVIPVTLGLLVGCYTLWKSWGTLWRFFQNLIP